MNGRQRSSSVLADQERANAANGPGEDAGASNRLVEGVRSELEAHDRRSEMESPDRATARDAERPQDIEQAREEARRLRESSRRSDGGR
jgi:hypothetical protein